MKPGRENIGCGEMTQMMEGAGCYFVDFSKGYCYNEAVNQMKKGTMTMKKRIISMLLALALVLGAFGGVTVRAAESNLALNRPATASSVANDCGPELAVDGVTAGPQWNSENMKNGTVYDV